MQLKVVEFNGVPGNTAFNPNVDGTGHPTTNSTCGQTQTKGFGNCRSAETTSAGNTLLEASVFYFNAMHLANAAPNLDIWAGMRLTFANTFVGGDAFGYKIDTDLLGSVSLDSSTPEPGTVGMAGAALAIIGLLKLRLRKS